MIRLALLALPYALLGCSTEVVDPLVLPLLHLIPEAVIRSDPDSGAPAWTLITDVTLDREGNVVVVVDVGSPGVYRYDRRGSFLGILGGEGQGPGEYRDPVEVVSLPDGRFAIWDPGNMRVLIYEEGSLPESFRVSTATYRADRSLYAVGDSLLLIRARVTAVEEVGPGALGFLSYAVDGTPREVVLPPWPPRSLQSIRGPMSGTVPLTGTDIWVVTNDGELVASHRDAYEVVRMNLQGDTLATHREEASPVSVLPGEAKAYRGAVEHVFRKMEAGWTWPRGLAFPEQKPVIADIVPVVGGGFAVVLHGSGVEMPERARPGRVHWSERRRIDIYDPEGVGVGSFILPLGQALMRILPDRVLAIERDHLDRPQIYVYRLVDAS